MFLMRMPESFSLTILIPGNCVWMGLQKKAGLPFILLATQLSLRIKDPWLSVPVFRRVWLFLGAGLGSWFWGNGLLVDADAHAKRNFFRNLVQGGHCAAEKA
jgi:hypothetical protein